MAAFNEADAVRGGWPPDLRGAPELFHLEIASLMVADGLNASLHWFEPRLRDVRAELNGLDIDQPAGTQVIRLRNRLLELSREVSTVSGDVTTLVDDAVMIWADFSPTWLDSSRPATRRHTLRQPRTRNDSNSAQPWPAFRPRRWSFGI